MKFKLLAPALAFACATAAATATAAPGDSQVARWKDNRTAVFLLMFSDSVPSHYQIVVPELVKRDLIATFYVNPGGNKWSHSKDPTPRNQWENVIPKTGMVYGNHSMTHTGIKDPSQAEYEIGEPTRIIRKLMYGDDKPRLVSWNMPGAVPWKITPEETAALLKKHNLIDKPKFDAKHGAVFGVKTIPEMLALADKAIAEKGMEYLIVHGVERRASEGDPGWSWQDYWALNKDVFRGVLDGVAERKARGDLWVTDHISQHKYAKERDNKPVFQVLKSTDRELRLTLTGTLDHALYDLPLTVMTSVPATWPAAIVTQGTFRSTVPAVKGLITYDALPNGEPITVVPGRMPSPTSDKKPNTGAQTTLPPTPSDSLTS
ncbi:MAG TPA: hypothetical protein VIO38_03595 [Rariglobus sp.]